jgi:dipeptidyl aminopeptidase/acylaminoacyl peptidase
MTRLLGATLVLLTLVPGVPAGAQELPHFPPFVGVVLNHDRRGERVVLCADQSGPAVATGVRQLSRTKVWLLDREVLEDVRDHPGLCDPKWSPIADEFAAVSAQGVWLFRVPLDGGRLLRATRAESAVGTEFGYERALAPAWSPDGRRLAFAVTNGGVSHVEVIDVRDGAEVHRSRPGPADFEWQNDGRTIRIGKQRVTLPE